MRRHAAALCLAGLLAFAAMPAAAQDAGQGARLFRICGVCHRVGPGAHNAVGPPLNGVVGRKAGTAEGFAYSQAMRESGLVWDEATLLRFIEAPRETVPGTKMTFAGYADEAKAKDVIAYLKTFGPDGKPTQP